MELDGLGWGNAGRQEVRGGDEEVLGRSFELSDTGRSPEMNDEARRVESVSITKMWG